MNKIIVMAVAAVGLLLASCTESSIAKAQEAAALVKKNCGIIVSVADIAAAFSAANPIVTTAVAMAHAICAQADRTEHGSSSDSSMYGAVILVQDSDPLPLPEPKPPTVPEVEDVPPETDEQEEEVECVAVVNGVCIRKEEDVK